MAASKRTTFKMPYVGIAVDKGVTILYGDQGDFSVIFQITNPALQYGADAAPYIAFHQLMAGLIQILGEGYIMQKQDVFFRQTYKGQPAEEFLQQKYHAHFLGREYTGLKSYLTITRQVKKNTFFTYDQKVYADFHQMVAKTGDMLEGAGLNAVLLDEKEVRFFVNRILGMDFSSPAIVLNNLKAGDEELEIGERSIRCISLINTDSIDLPEKISTYSEKQDNKGLQGFPMDNLSFLFQVPEFQSIIYNQVIEIPAQRLTVNKLELKRKRHSGVPDPANLICVEDIDQLLVNVARENQLLVNVHYSIAVCAEQTKLSKAVNFIEAALFQQGILCSRNAYNQLELYRCLLPGNAVELKKYDWFLTTSDAALCLFFKESLPVDEDSSLLVRFTDRQGIPVAIDLSDLPMRTGRINNRNKFVLGPSGSGKSFFMNALIEQYMLSNMDIVIVDVGHSYSGLCSYYGGKYITYSETSPITMNPFAIGRDEFNIEKKDFLVTLVSLLWKGTDGTVSNVERDVIASVISSYYSHYFDDDDVPIDGLSFNSFYEFALEAIPTIKSQERIPFDLDEFRFVLKKFYRNGEYQSILNEPVDKGLFSERFIVYEIDNVQNNKILFPIITLIIMDVFIQKMRHRTNQRKALVLEEAWKAITSPLMATFLLNMNKTVRKFWGEIIEVTQSLSDVLDNPILKESIISESDTVILLDQSKFRDNYQQIARLLSISETERKKIFTIGKLDNKDKRGRYKEVYIRRGSIGEVYGVEVSIYQYMAYTTEQPEKSALKIYVAASGNYQKGLEAFVSDFTRSGLSLSEFTGKVNQGRKPLSLISQEYFKPQVEPNSNRFYEESTSPDGPAGNEGRPESSDLY